MSYTQYPQYNNNKYNKRKEEEKNEICCKERNIIRKFDKYVKGDINKKLDTNTYRNKV